MCTCKFQAYCTVYVCSWLNFAWVLATSQKMGISVSAAVLAQVANSMPVHKNKTSWSNYQCNSTNDSILPTKIHKMRLQVCSWCFPIKNMKVCHLDTLNNLDIVNLRFLLGLLKNIQLMHWSNWSMPPKWYKKVWNDSALSCKIRLKKQ